MWDWQIESSKQQHRGTWVLHGMQDSILISSIEMTQASRGRPTVTPARLAWLLRACLIWRGLPPAKLGLSGPCWVKPQPLSLLKKNIFFLMVTNARLDQFGKDGRLVDVALHTPRLRTGEFDKAWITRASRARSSQLGPTKSNQQHTNPRIKGTFIPYAHNT